MSAQNGHITSKVILGYLLLILIAVCSVVYIYNIIEQFAGEDDPNNKSREKVYLVTNTLSLLYESEALGQMVGFPQGEIKHFNRTLNKALQNMDSLRTLVSNPALYPKIDTIDMLIEQKRRNTRRLLETWRETNAEHLYTQNIEKVIARQDTMIRQVASSSATVLIRGASGTGKELLARALQRSGDRRDKPFVVVNSAALPENLIESELFGHEKGAFTGAVNRRIGRVEAASSGTLFLDEIGDVGPQVQVKLLRFLQERTFQRVGGNEELSADVRIIAATSRNLEKLMEQGLFREDLYYRLNVFPIVLPDLAERRSDIPLLAEHFREKFSKLHHRRVRRISAPAMNLMVDYAWPGNIRELENCMERAVLSATDDTIHTFCLPAALQGVRPAGPRAPVFGDFTARVEAFEREMLDEALKAHRGNVAAAARSLNLTIRIIHYKIRKLGLDPAAYR